MNITTLINLFRDTLKDNETISHWCETNFSKEHTVYKGMDQRNPPASTEYPLVHLYPVNKRVGSGQDEASHVIGVTCGVYKDSVTTTDATHGVLKEYAGIDLLEAFRKLVENAVVAALPAEASLSMLNIEYETIEFFPFLLASMEFVITIPYVLGTDIFA
jgi:hypothetical protein